MPWLDQSGATVTDPMVMKSLGTPPSSAAQPAGGHWEDASGNAVNDPMIVKSLEAGGDNVPGAPRGLARLAGQGWRNIAGGLLSSTSPLAAAGTAEAQMNNPEAAAIKGLTPQTAMQAQQQTASGLVNAPGYQPQGAGERLLTAGERGLGGMLPFLPFGGGPTAAARLGVQGITGGIGSQIGSDYYPKDWWGSRAAPMVGSLLGAQAGGSMVDAATQAINAIRSPSEVLQAYDTLGVTPRLRGDITGNVDDIYRQNAALSLPGGTKMGNEAVTKTLNEFNQGVEGTAAQLGDSKTLQQLGSVAQSKARDWLQNDLPKQTEDVWAPVNRAMTNAPVKLDNYTAALQQLKSQGPLAQSINILRGSLPQKLAGALEADAAAGAPTTWGDVQQLRSTLGDAMGTPEIADQLGQQNLSKLYGALSQDMQGAAAVRGAGPAFGIANQTTRQAMAFRDNVISKIVSAKNPDLEMIAPSQAAQNILNTLPSGDTTIAGIRMRMPDLADEVGAYKLRDMVLATPGRQNAAGTAISPQQFLTDWNSMSPEAQKALFGMNPAVANKVNAATIIADRFKQTAALVNTSRTTPAAAARAAAEAPLSGLEGAVEGGIAGHYLGGMIGAPGIGAVVGAPLGAAAKSMGPFVGGRLAAMRSFSPWYNRFLASQPSYVAPAVKQIGNVMPGLLAGAQQ